MKHTTASEDLRWVLSVPRYRDLERPPGPLPFRCVLCREQDFELYLYQFWCAKIKETPRYHRKQWEFVYISQALWERGFLRPGVKGLGFGVGREPLPALFASYGCEILATDLNPEEAQAMGWVVSNQYAGAPEHLNDRGICDPALFRQRARFEIVDMNNIPSYLSGFDFCWSACALEHLGSRENGLQFIRNSLDCLDPGGLAIHTTEFNISSNSETLDQGSTVLFRRRDLEELVAELQTCGHYVEPLNLDPGSGPVDSYIDTPPYCPEPHLKLWVGNFVTTSIGIIIQKATR